MALGFGDGVKKKEKMQRSLGALKLLYASLEKYLIALLLLLASMVAYGFMNFEKLNDWYFVCFVLGIDAICVLWVFIYYKQTQVWEAINIVETEEARQDTLILSRISGGLSPAQMRMLMRHSRNRTFSPNHQDQNEDK